MGRTKGAQLDTRSAQINYMYRLAAAVKGYLHINPSKGEGCDDLWDKYNPQIREVIGKFNSRTRKNIVAIGEVPYIYCRSDFWFGDFPKADLDEDGKLTLKASCLVTHVIFILIAEEELDKAGTENSRPLAGWDVEKNYKPRMT